LTKGDDTVVVHVADQFEPVEELVAGYFQQTGNNDFLEWKVYDDNYNLGNEYTKSNSAYNNGWCTQTYYIIPSLGEAVDNTDFYWDTGGKVNWFGQTSTYYYGSDTAQSGTISHNEESWMQIGVQGPGTLKFYWKVSSEGSFDFLEFWIDNTRMDKISGTVDWQQKSYSISSGSHAVKWRYMKDGSVHSGSDCGWVDKVEFTSGGGGGDLITSKSGTLSGTGASYTFSVSGYSTVTVVMAGNENADFDLYAKWNSQPTTSSYDARGYSSWAQEIAGPASGSGTLYFMVHSYSGSGEYATVGLIF